jgi:hypothetical protein
MSVVEKLTVLLEAKDRLSAGLQSGIRSLAGFSNAAQSGGKNLGALEAGLGMVSKAAGALGITLSAVQLTKFAVDAARLAEANKGVEESFNKLAEGVGQSGRAMLDAMQKASSGQISQNSLMLSANKAMLLGVADTSEEMSALMEVAAERGQAMGLSMEQAFGDIVTGLGRVSPMILDNLGITINAEETYAAYAASIGVAADALSDAEKKQALVNAVMSEANGVVDANVNEFATLGAAYADLKIALGELASPAIIAGLSALSGAIAGLNEKIAENSVIAAEKEFFSVGDDIARAAESLQAANASLTDAIVNQGDVAAATSRITSLQTHIKFLGEEYNAVAKKTGAPLLDLDALAAGTVAFAEVAASAEDAGERIVNGMVRAAKGIDSLRASLGSALAEFSSGARSMMDRVTALGDGRGGGKLDLLNESLADSKTIVGKVGESFSTATAGVSEAERAFGNLQSKLQGIISGAIGPVAGIDAADLLPREDAVNENARRLADIAVNGFTGQDWLGEFASEVPDLYEMLSASGDPQTAAAQMLKDFQDGLRPELIDTERAKELVLRAIRGEENTKALVEQVANEIAAEQGIAFSKAQEAAGEVLGGGSTIAKSLDLEEKAAEDSGKKTGKAYGLALVGAFEENVPGRLVQILAMMVTPEVIAAIGAGETRAGVVNG